MMFVDPASKMFVLIPNRKCSITLLQYSLLCSSISVSSNCVYFPATLDKASSNRGRSSGMWAHELYVGELIISTVTGRTCITFTLCCYWAIVFHFYVALYGSKYFLKCALVRMCTYISGERPDWSFHKWWTMYPTLFWCFLHVLHVYMYMP